jgi:hypothetical protein
MATKKSQTSVVTSKKIEVEAKVEVEEKKPLDNVSLKARPGSFSALISQ